MEYIKIKMDNGTIQVVRSQIESATEDPLTIHEEIINKLYNDLQIIEGNTLFMQYCNNKKCNHNLLQKCNDKNNKGLCAIWKI